MPVENRETETPRVRYQIAPEDLIRIQREAREAGLEILGYYHSHPDHPARPSETDRRVAAEGLSDGVIHVVVGVGEGERRRAHRLGLPRRDAGVRRKSRSRSSTEGDDMAIKVQIPSPLRSLTGGAEEVQVEAGGRGRR